MGLRDISRGIRILRTGYGRQVFFISSNIKELMTRFLKGDIKSIALFIGGLPDFFEARTHALRSRIGNKLACFFSY
jgi:hypothetical protein